LKLLNEFKSVLLMDSSYKTNKLSSLKECWCDIHEVEFSLWYLSCMRCEWENNFILTFERLRGLFMRVDVIPQVLVTEKDISLINATTIIFPIFCNLLCKFHIKKKC